MSDDKSSKTRISNLFSKQGEGPPEGGIFDSTAKLDEMSAAPSQGGGSRQVSASSQEANPFASEFRTGDASQMSMEMSAFSQFFKEGGSSPGRRIVLLLGVFVLVVGGFYMFQQGGGTGEDFSSTSDEYEEDYDEDDVEDDADEFLDAEEENPDNMADSAASDDEFSADDAQESAEEELADSYDEPSYGGEGAPQLNLPADGQVRNYDETSEYALFEWSGEPGGKLLLSRNAAMNPLERSVQVTGNSYRLAHPWPGTWYWQVENGEGLSEVSRFTVDPPVRRQLMLAPLPSPLSGSSGVVSWSGDTKVARYAVELSQSGWSQPQWRYQTSGTAVTLDNVTPGQYQLRVGAFSEVSGRWEYTTPTAVTVE